MSDVSKTNELIAELKDLNAITEYTDDWLSDLVGRAADALEAATRVPVQGEPNGDREALGWREAEEYAPDDIDAQDDFMTGWRMADRSPRATVPDAATAAIERIRVAVSGHPECDRYSEDDVISCGWKSAYASVVAALDGAPEPEVKP